MHRIKQLAWRLWWRWWGWRRPDKATDKWVAAVNAAADKWERNQHHLSLDDWHDLTRGHDQWP